MQLADLISLISFPVNSILFIPVLLEEVTSVLFFPGQPYHKYAFWRDDWTPEKLWMWDEKTFHPFGTT